jgi:hypothetical protein
MTYVAQTQRMTTESEKTLAAMRLSIQEASRHIESVFDRAEVLILEVHKTVEAYAQALEVMESMLKDEKT